ncbi:MAG: hypothetical protein HN976_11175, partial [Lentisphaerae bacterium]|nr:hypothetical protein [Lentisphaerota bacterium]
MAYPGVVDDFRACCEHRTPSRLPVFALGLEFDMEVFGLTCSQSRTDVDAMVRCKTQAVDTFDYDLTEIFPDDYIEAEGFELDVVVREDLSQVIVEGVDGLSLTADHRVDIR